MIVLRNKYFSEKREDKNRKPKLSKSDKVALGTAAAGLGIAEVGQGYSNLMKKRFLKRTEDWYKSRGDSVDKARKLASMDWAIASPDKTPLRDIRKMTKGFKEYVGKVHRGEIDRPKDFDLCRINSLGANDILRRRGGQIATKVGLGLAGASLAGGLYYRNKKNKRKDDTTED